MAFVGRKSELALLAGALEASAGGQPAVVWIEGEAGSGKTSLLRQALTDLPPETVTVRARGDELAMEAPYELVRQLGVGVSEVGFAAGQQLLKIWSREQAAGPLLVVVEDLHWADPGSSQALLSAVRRLEVDRVAVIVTSRGPIKGWDRFAREDERCRSVLLHPFESSDVAELAALHGIDLSHRQAARLTRHTGGHPLWVETLLVELTPKALQAPGDLPAPRSLASAVTARLGEVTVPGQQLAAAIAVINQRTALAVAGRVANIPHPLEALEALLASGLVRWDPREAATVVEFAHPLYRQAVYEDLSPTRRRDLHQSAAQILAPDVVLAHRVAAADGVDDALSDELVNAARTDQAGGAYAMAARNLLWAAPLSSRPERSEQLLVEAGLAFVDYGQPTRAALLRDQIQAGRSSPVRNLVLGLIDWEQGDAAGAERWLRKATELGSSEQKQWVARAWAQLAEMEVVEGRATEAVDSAEQALLLAEPDTPAERLAWAHRSVGQAMQQGGPAGLEGLAARLPADPGQIPGRDVDLLVTRATLGYYSARPEATLADLQAVFRLARRGSAPVQLARCHYLMAAILTHRGDWDDALVHARTAMSIVADDQLVWIQPQCHATIGSVLAYRGDWDRAEDHITRATEAAAAQQNLEAAGTARLANAALACARNEPERVIEALEGLVAAPPMFSALYFWPSFLNALIQAGRIDVADEQMQRLSAAAAVRGIDIDARLLPVRARLAAASGRPDEAAQLFEAASARLGPNDPYLERAFTHQDYGRLLHACGERRRGIDELRIARQMLSSVGAVPFIVRVDADLAFAGLPSAPPSPSRTGFTLTDRECDVAVLVAKGMSNPEVAAQLYISRKAVEFHLRNIYGKLGITSRRQLRDRQAAF